MLERIMILTDRIEAIKALNGNKEDEQVLRYRMAIDVLKRLLREE